MSQLGESPSDGHIRYTHTSSPHHDQVVARHEGKDIGILQVHSWDEAGGRVGEISDVEVHPDYWRRGVATGMLRHVTNVGVQVSHNAERSDAWARSLGAPVRSRQREYQPEDYLFQ